MNENLAPIIESEPGPDLIPQEQEIENKPRRGRPPGSKNKVVESRETPEPININAANEKRRGRPPGSGTRKTVDKSALAKQLLFAHAVAAQITKIPDIAIDSGEADILSGAITNLMIEYDIALSGKTAAMMGMLGAVAIVYGPRVVLITDKIKRAKANAKAQTEGLIQVADNG